MRIISYSDLHLEYGSQIRPPADVIADILILAGDIITFGDFALLGEFLSNWKKPVLYVAGNHEHYTPQPMAAGNAAFKMWLADHHPNVWYLQDKHVTIDGVHFFGGTMWTDFFRADKSVMDTAQQRMKDFRQISIAKHRLLTPADTVILHYRFVRKLVAWLKKDLDGPHVVVTHHAPVKNAHTKHKNSPLSPAYVSLDMKLIIEKYQPDLWIYGHTHECDDQTIGKTRIISNQHGYPHRSPGPCGDFDETGLQVEVRSVAEMA